MRVLSSLARFHGLRLLRHPVMTIGVIGSVAVFWLVTRDIAPVLNREGIVLVGSCLVLATLAVVVADFAVRRDLRDDMSEMLDAMPTSTDRRVLGHALGGWTVMVFSLLVVGVGLGWMYLNRPVGSVPWWELAGAPAVVLLGYMTGVAVGRWLAIPLAAPLVVVGLAAWFLLPTLLASTSTASPYFPFFASDDQVPQAFPRMAAVHAAYVLGLAVLLIGVAARRWKLMVGVMVVVVASALALSSIPVGSQRGGMLGEWLASQGHVCEERNGVEFCAVAGYEPWIDYWAEVADGVSVVAPITGVTLRQGVDTEIGFTWNTAGWMALGLAEALVRPTLGIPVEITPDPVECSIPFLDLSGQGRGVASVVAAAMATPATEEFFRLQFTDQQGLDRPFGVSARVGDPISGPEHLLALQILDLPRHRVQSTLAEKWSDLADPQITTADLAGWLDLPAPDIPPAVEWVCECHPDGSMECTSR